VTEEGAGPVPSPLELEILETLWNDSETVATVFPDLSHPSFSSAAQALDRAGLDAVFRRLNQFGLVAGHEEPHDGFEGRPGKTYTWWSLTAAGERAVEARDASRDVASPSETRSDR